MKWILTQNKKLKKDFQGNRMMEKCLSNVETAGKMNRPAGEKEEIYVRTNDRAFCLLCDETVRLVDFQDATNYLKKTLEEVFNLANKHKLHRLHNRAATVMVCSDSLFRQFENQQTRNLKTKSLPG